MIVYRDYDEEARIDRAWYNSSNVLYSECKDNLNELKTLKVVFKNGGTYIYEDVDVTDYLMFMHGGLDGSNGKALNKYIIPKCKYKRIDNTDITLLNEDLARRQEEDAKKTVESN